MVGITFSIKGVNIMSEEEIFSFVLLDENDEPFLETQNELQMVMMMRTSATMYGFAKGETWYYRPGEEEAYRKEKFLSPFL